MTSLRKFSIVLLVIAALAGVMASPAQAQVSVSCSVPSSLPVGSPNSISCIASGGTSPYGFTYSGSIPLGMSPFSSINEFVISGNPQVAGSYTFTVTATDANSHTGTSQSYTANVTNGSGTGGSGGSLVLNSLSQSSDPAGTSFVLTVFGSGFTTSSVIVFNGFSLGTSFINSGQLTATVPGGDVSGSLVSVYVHDNSSGASSGSLQFTVGSGSGGGGSVSITSISPTSIPLNTAFTLTVFGSGFSQGQLVTFGNNSYASSFLGSTELQVNIPAAALTTAQTVNVSVAGSNSEPFTIGTGGSTGTLSITCTTSTGSLTIGVYYTEFCSVSGGNGTYFWSTSNLPGGLTLSNTSGSTVGISGTPTSSQSYTVNASDTAGHQGSLTITPTGSGGSSGYNISSLSPSSLAVNSGSTIVIVFGAGFTGSSQVYFNGNLLTTQYVSANQLNATFPSNLLTVSGTYNVFVNTPGLGSTNSASFTVGSGGGSGVTLSSISPTSVAVGSGAFTLNLFGSGFSSGQLVTFAGTSLSPVFINSGQLQVTVPSYLLTTAQTVNVSVGGSNSVQFIIGAGSTGTLTVSCSPSTGPTTIGVYYQQNCFVSGGTSPYTWTVYNMPSGLNQSAYTGGSQVTISGTPTVSQSYTYTVQVNDSAGHVGSLQITGTTSSSGSSYNVTSLQPSSVAVGSAGITLSVLGNGFNTSSFVYFNGSQLSTTYISATQLNATLPASFLTTAETASVSVYTSGVYTNTVTFTVGTGSSTGGTLTVSCTPGIGPATVGTFYSTTCTASGGNQPYNWPSPSGLPSYLVYSASTGPSITISGTPNVSVPYNFLVKVTDSSSPVQTGSLQLAGETGASSTGSGSIVLTSVTPTSTPVNSAAVTLNLFGSGFSSNSQVVFDGFAVVTTFLNASQLTATVPAGLLTVSRSVLVSVSTPGAGSSNGLTFVIGNGGNGIQTSITCSPGTGPASPNSYYTANCTVNGGTGPYTWSVVNGSLPTGLSLTPNGALASINGYTTLSGPYSYTMQVTDSSAVPNTATLVFAGETGPGGTGSSGLSISSLSPSSTPVGSGALTLTVVGNGFTTASQVYYNGAPLSTTFVNTGQLTATIPAGNLATAQNASVTVVSSGATSNALTFVVGTASSTPISISCNPTTGPAAAGSTYTTSCTATGGRAPYTWTGIGVPFGLAVTNSNTSTVSVTGTLFGGSYNYSLQVTDSSTPALTQTYPFIGSLAQASSATITSMFPVSTSGGSGAFTVTITGTGFVSGVTQVEFGSTLLLTSVNSSNQLTATVPASLVASPGNIMVQLFGTGSNTVDFFVTAGGASGVSPASLSFTYGLGGTLPAAQTLTVSNLNGATGFSAVASGIADGINWLVLNQASSVIPGSISVSVSPAGLPIGSYSGTLTLTGFGVGTSVVIPVTLNVVGAPTLKPSITNLTLSSPVGGTASQTINVTSTDGTTVFAYTVAELTNNGGNFLSVSPTSGTTPGSFTVTAAAGNLVPSTYSGSITLTSTGSLGSQVSVPVTFIVTAPGAITVNPTSLSFSSVVGQTAPASQNISVSSSNSATVNYTVAATTTSGGNWLTATPTGTTPGNIAVSITVGTLAAGTYNGTVTVTAPGATNSPLTVPVTFTLTAAPSLTSSPTSLTFSSQTGGSAPAPQALSIAGPNNLNFNYTIAVATTTGGNWLSVSSTSGSTPSSVAVSVNPANLSAGTYNGTLTVTAAGVGPLTVAVTLTVTSPFTLTVSPSTLTFNTTVSGTAPPAQTVSVSASNNVAANYTVTATSTGNWLSATASGTTPGTISVSVNPSGLAVGPYTGSLSISAPGGTNNPQTVQVTLNVGGPPAITAIPGLLSFLVPGDGSTPSPQSITVISSGANTSFTATAVSQGGNWLSVSPGGTTPGSIMVSVNPAGLVPGQTYNGSVTINAPASNPTSLQVAVTLTLAPQGTLPLVVAPQTVYLSYPQGAGSDLEHVAVLNNGGGTVNFTAQAQTASCGSWLTVVTPSGSATASSPAVLAFNVNPSGLSSQTCRGTLVVTDSNGNVSNVPVLMAISGQTQAVLLSQTAMNFVTTTNGSAPPPQTFQILNPGSGSMQWNITAQVLSGGSWLTVAPNSGSSQSLSQAGSPISVSVNPQGLTPGTYYGSIQVTSSGTFNSPQSITVTFQILPPPPPGVTSSGVPPQITPSGAIITVANGASDTQTVNITNSGTTALTFVSAVITDDGQNWLTVSPTSGSVSAGGTSALSLTANTNGLTGGIRHGTLRVAFADGTYQTVDVQLAQAGASPGTAGVRACGAANLVMEFLTPSQNFVSIAGQAIPLQVVVKDCNGNLLTNSSTGADVLVGSSDIKLNYTGNGVWAGTWTPIGVSPVVNLTARAIEVTGGTTASGAVTATGNAGPFAANGPPFVGSLVNAASFLLPGLVAPGTMVTAFGAALADGQQQVFSVPFPTTLQNAQFMIRGVALPMFYASSGQVNAIVPIGLNPNERDQLVVVRDTTQSAPVDLLMADVDPGSFATNQQGTGQGAILVGGTAQLAAPVGTVPGAGPATANQVISIFLAGLGNVTNPPADGSPSSGSNPSTTPTTPTVTIGGLPAVVSYSGLAPGEVGLYQINATVPAGAPTGSAVPVVVTLGNGVSNTVTIAIM